MTIFKIIGFGIIAVSLIIILKNQKPEIALICVIASSIIMLAFIFNELKSVISLINSLILIVFHLNCFVSGSYAEINEYSFNF